MVDDEMLDNPFRVINLEGIFKVVSYQEGLAITYNKRDDTPVLFYGRLCEIEVYMTLMTQDKYDRLVQKHIKKSLELIISDIKNSGISDYECHSVCKIDLQTIGYTERFAVVAYGNIGNNIILDLEGKNV